MGEQRTRREILKLLALGSIGVGIAFYGIRVPDEEQQLKAKDGIAAIASGVLAHNIYGPLYGPSVIEARKHVPYWFDSMITGDISRNAISLKMDDHAIFEARGGPRGLEGELLKPGLNWRITQKGNPYCFDISRYMQKIDSYLSLEAKDGKINGAYNALSADFPIKGDYDNNGRIHLVVGGPGGEATVTGKVYRRSSF